jgi:glutamine amidotransferase
MLAILDYGGGNLRSVKRACDAVGLDALFTQEPAKVKAATRIIFPGVGHAKTAMDTLQRSGLHDALLEAHARGVPVLGICVGAQLVLDGSEEGPTKGLSLLPGMTRRFDLKDKALKVPHIGWNEVTVTRPHPLLAGLTPGDELYFVHSYYFAPSQPEHVLAQADYGGPFCCALGKGNLFATQFHPEKSGRLGLDLLARFSRWDGDSC